MSHTTRLTLSQSRIMAETYEGDFPFWNLWVTAQEGKEPFSMALHATKTGSVGRSNGKQRKVFLYREIMAPHRGHVTMIWAPSSFLNRGLLEHRCTYFIVLFLCITDLWVLTCSDSRIGWLKQRWYSSQSSSSLPCDPLPDKRSDTCMAGWAHGFQKPWKVQGLARKCALYVTVADWAPTHRARHHPRRERCSLDDGYFNMPYAGNLKKNKLCLSTFHSGCYFREKKHSKRCHWAVSFCSKQVLIFHRIFSKWRPSWEFPSEYFV